MARSSVTVVPLGEGRFMIVPSELADSLRHGDEDVDRHTEVSLREILKDRYGMSPEEIEEHVAVAKALAEEPGP